MVIWSKIRKAAIYSKLWNYSHLGHGAKKDRTPDLLTASQVRYFEPINTRPQYRRKIAKKRKRIDCSVLNFPSGSMNSLSKKTVLKVCHICAIFISKRTKKSQKI